MHNLLYTIIFIMGSFFGSFAMLAIKNIPSKKNIISEKPCCQHCNHRLSFYDSIPILSYLFLKGKCRYCGKKQKTDMFFAEIIMAVISVGIYISTSRSWGVMSITTLTEYVYLMVLVTSTIIIAGIDKKYKKIYKPIIFIGCFIGLIHVIYLYFTNNTSIVSLYTFFLYLGIIIVLSFITIRKPYLKYTYLLEILIMCLYINMFVVSEVFLITTIITILLITCDILFKRRKLTIDKSDILAENDKKVDIPIGYWLSISNIIAILIQGIQIL